MQAYLWYSYSLFSSFTGRSTGLIPHTCGVLTNPNCEFEVNFVAMHTLATWWKSHSEGGQDGEKLNDIPGSFMITFYYILFIATLMLGWYLRIEVTHCFIQVAAYWPRAVRLQ